MAQQEFRELSMWRINAIIGDSIRLIYTVAWNELDALHRTSQRMRSEGNTLYTLSILDRRAL